MNVLNPKATLLLNKLGCFHLAVCLCAGMSPSAIAQSDTPVDINEVVVCPMNPVIPVEM